MTLQTKIPMAGTLLNEPDSSVTRKLKTGKLVIGIDRDGTLVDIASRPELAPVTGAVQDTVSSAAHARDLTCAIVSARSLPHLKKDFGTTGAILAGNYGLEIQLDKDKLLVNQDAVKSRSRLEAVLSRLEQEMGFIDGFIIEDHGLSICGHWHLVKESERAEVHNAFAVLKRDFADLRFVDQKTSYEVFPQLDWDKGLALEQIALHAWGNLTEGTMLFIGDSIGDEPAFDFVNRHGGISIRVGNFQTTCARFTLPGPAAVLAFLQGLVAARS